MIMSLTDGADAAAEKDRIAVVREEDTMIRRQAFDNMVKILFYSGLRG